MRANCQDQRKVDIRCFHLKTIQNLKLNEEFIDDLLPDLDDRSRSLLKVACRRTLICIMQDILPEQYLLPKSAVAALPAQVVSNDDLEGFKDSLRATVVASEGEIAPAGTKSIAKRRIMETLGALWPRRSATCS